MPTTLHTHDLILRMKKIKDEQQLSPQNIYEELEKNGYHVSLNSIKKVFSEGSENEHFRFHDTIQPISRVLFDIYGENEDDSSEVEGLKAAIRVKDELITKLEQENASLNFDSRRRIDYLKSQISLKDDRIDRLMSRVDVLIGQLDKLLNRCESCRAKQNNDGCL